MALDLSTNSAEVQEAIAEVRDPGSETNWCLLGYAGKTNTIKLVEKDDDGIDGLVGELNGAQVQYGYLSVEDPNTQLTKYVIINWAGDAASTAQKGALPRHSRDIADMLRGAHVTINARCEDDCDEETILDKVSRAAGANYSNQERGKKANPKFANTEPEKASSAYTNKYKQEATASQEERAGFWGSEDAAEKERVLAEKATKAAEDQALAAERKQAQAESEARRAEMQAQREAELAAATGAEEEAAAAAAAAAAEEAEAAAAAHAEQEAAAAAQAQADADAEAEAAAAQAQADAAAYADAEAAAAAQAQAEAAAEAEAAAAAEAEAEAAATAQAQADAEAYADAEAAQAQADAEAYADAEAAAAAQAQANADAEAEAAAAVAAQIEVVDENNSTKAEAAMGGKCAKALYDYQAAGEDEVTFDPEEIIEDIEMVDEGWWIGTVRGTRGLFPANYVELME